MRHSFDDREVNLFDLATLEQLTVNRHRAGAFRKEQHACGLRIDSMNEPQKLEVARARPEIARCYRRLDRELQISSGAFPGSRHQHPADRFIDGEHGAILIKNRDDRSVAQFDVLWFGHDVS